MEQMYEEAMRAATFFKIIHPRLNTTQQLRLPTAFLKFIEKDESEMAFLHTPISKDGYGIKLLKTEDGVILEDGWQKFLTDHSLGNYEFLVFSYQGSMTFTVRIFDMSGCEKQYKLKEPAPEKLDIPSVSRPPKKLGRPPKKLGRPPKKLPPIPSVRRRGRPRKPDEFVCDNKDFKSDLPHFTVGVGKYSLRPWNIMRIHRDFANMHISKSKEVVVLRVKSGKSWSVKFYPVVCAFCAGWSAFVRDNEIKLGDSCVFELVGVLEFCVYIFPK